MYHYVKPKDIEYPYFNYLDLKKPIYQNTAAYGHFGREIFNWEKIDLSL